MASVSSSRPTTDLATAAARPPARRRRQFLAAIGKSRTGTVGWAILVFFVLMAAIGPFLTPHDPTAQDLRQRIGVC